MNKIDFQIQTSPEFVKQHISDGEVDELVVFYKHELQKLILRGDYSEIIELPIIFLGGDGDKHLKIRLPGSMYQAWWLARAIYSLKICLLQSQHKISTKDKQSLRDIWLFIVTVYVKPWLDCNLAVKAPNQDLHFLKTLKGYEKIDTVISEASLKNNC